MDGRDSHVENHAAARLARIEAVAGRDASDLLELRDRCLELFKVQSRNGVPEVWLLGQRLLGASSAGPKPPNTTP